MNLDLLRSLNYWIFDMDGTLTIPEHNFPYMRKMVGLPEGETDILKFLQTLPKEEADQKLEWLYENGREIANNAKPSPMAVETVQWLHKNGRKLALLTRNERSLALLTLERIGLLPYFEPHLILGRGEAPSKPNPDGILSILASWQVSPQNAIMVGDYHFDIDAGINAGTHTLLINREENISPDKAQFYFKDFSLLYSALRSE